jgi:hypothetical protein
MFRALLCPSSGAFQFFCKHSLRSPSAAKVVVYSSYVILRSRINKVFKRFWNCCASCWFNSLLLSVMHGTMNLKKSKIHTRTGHKDKEGEYMYNSILSLTSALEGWVGNAKLQPFYPLERPGTHCIGGWVGPSAGRDRCGKTCPHRIWSPGPFSRQRVAMPAELTRPDVSNCMTYNPLHMVIGTREGYSWETWR